MKRTVTKLENTESTEIQREYISKLKKENSEFCMKTGSNRTYDIVTFGCQMNAHDSEKIEKFFSDMGYAKGKDEFSSDVVVYNTCCVRENAENKVYGNLGYLKHLKEQGREFKIILCGCMMQQDAVVDKIRKTYKNTDIILGTFNLHRLPQLLWTSYETGDLIIDVWEEQGEIVSDLPSLREKPFRASVNIMYGCDNFCTYCIVPYVRGRERSRASAEILSEIEALAADGVKEIMLLGQNVNSYKDGDGTDFSELLKLVSAINGIERIRFMTSHPKDLSDRLVSELASNPKVCGHIHLPVQSGSTKILHKMNRRYTKEDYLKLVGKIKQAVPDIAITTDIIVGFPGETEEDFNETLDLVKRVRFAGAFTFLYSKRTGTPAATMPEQVPEDEAKKRFSELLAVLNPIVHDENEKQVGLTLSVLAEDLSDNGMLSGRADNNTIVHFHGESSLIGTIVNVKIKSCKTFYCIGELSV